MSVISRDSAPLSAAIPIITDIYASPPVLSYFTYSFQQSTSSKDGDSFDPDFQVSTDLVKVSSWSFEVVLSHLS